MRELNKMITFNKCEGLAPGNQRAVARIHRDASKCDIRKQVFILVDLVQCEEEGLKGQKTVNVLRNTIEWLLLWLVQCEEEGLKGQKPSMSLETQLNGY